MPAASTSGRPLHERVAVFFDELFRLDPLRATATGDHRFDAEWPDMSEEGRRARLAFIDRWEADFAAVAFGRDEPGFGQHLQVLHDGLAADGKVLHEVGGRVGTAVANRPRVADGLAALPHAAAQVQARLARLLGQVGPRAEVGTLDGLDQHLGVRVGDRHVVDRLQARRARTGQDIDRRRSRPAAEKPGGGEDDEDQNSHDTLA